MIPGRIEGATRVFGAPVDWDKSKHGPCGGLPIRDEIFESGLRMMASAWFPTAEEILLISAGAPIELRINGAVHPVVILGVGKAPA